MSAWRRGLAAGLFLFVCAAQLRPEQPDEPKKPMPKGPGDVVIVTDPLADVLKMLPKHVLLSPEKYKELLAELDRLRKQAETDKPTPPGGCAVAGKLEPGRLQLTLRYQVSADRAGTFRLGGKKLAVTKATLDGKPAVGLRSEADGLYLTVDGPGERVLVLEAGVLVLPKGLTRSAEIDLPGALITGLDLELKPGLQDVRINETAWAETLVRYENDRLAGDLGQVEHLRLTWREPPVAGGPTVTSAAGTIDVAVDDRAQMTTTATLTLQVEAGRTSSWRLLLPPGAEVKPSPEAEPLVAGIDSADQPFAVLKTLRLKEATSASLTVTVRVPPKALPKGSRLPVGPFVVPGATRQTGTILVRSTARDAQLLLLPATETTPRQLGADEQKQATFVRGFKYDRVPQPEKPKAATGPGSFSLLDVEAETVRGVVEARLSHVLRLPRPGQEPRLWEATTTVKGRVVQPGVELLAIQLPAGAEYVAGPTPPPRPILADPAVDPATNVLQLRLERDGPKEFTFAFKVRYKDVPTEPTREATLVLPRPLDGALADEFAVQAVVADDLELVAADKPNPALEVTQTSPQEQSWLPAPTAGRVPDRVVLAWRPFRPEVQATATADVKLAGREANVRYELRLRLPRQAQGLLALRLPDGLAQPPRVVSGGKLVRDDDPDARTRQVQLDGPRDQDAVVVLDYAVALPDDGTRPPFAVPLPTPEAATTLRTVARIWSEPGVRPAATDKAWVEQPLHEVPGERRLPALVLRADGLDVPLTLRFATGQGRGGPLRGGPPVVARRALVRVLVQEGQPHLYHASYLLQQVAGRTVEVELPAPLVALDGVRFSLDGVQLDAEPLDDAGEPSDAGRVARLRLPAEAQTRPTLLDVTYQLTPRGTSPLATTLTPPVLRGEPGRVVSRWAITVPAGWVAFAPEEGLGTRRTWQRRGALLVSRPAESLADLEAWLAGGDAAPRDGDPAFANPALVCWRAGVPALVVWHAPQPYWLLACSLVVLAVGLGFVFWWRGVLADGGSPYPLLLALVAAALAPALLSLWFPTALAAVALGCQPGLAVLALVVLLQWWAHASERRRLRLTSSFTRTRQPSTVSRSAPVPASSPARPHPEPSTVDVQPPSGT